MSDQPATSHPFPAASGRSIQFVSRLSSAIFRLLAAPLRPFSDQAQVRRASILALLLFVSAWMLLFDALTAIVAGHQFAVPLLGTVLMLFCYGVSRTPHYRHAGQVAIAVMIFTPVLAVASNANQSIISQFYALDTLVILAVLVNFTHRALPGFLITLTTYAVTIIVGALVSRFNVIFFNVLEMSAVLVGLQTMIFLMRLYINRERAITTEALRQREAQYRAVIDDQSELVCRWKPDGTLTFVNGAYARFYDQTADALIGTTFYSHLRDGEAAQIRDIVLAFDPASENLFEREVQYRRGGQTRWVSWRIRPIFNGGGQLAEYQSVGRDVTEQRQIQEALRLREAQYRAVIEDQSEIICRWKPDGTLTFVNEAYSRMKGRPRAALIGLSFFDTVRPEEAAAIRASFARPPQPGEVLFNEFEYQTDHGYLCIAWTDRPIFNDRGELIEYQSVGRDITDQKRAEIALRESEARYRAIIDAQDDLICRWRPDTTITYANEVYARFQGVRPEALLGRRILDIAPADQHRLILSEVNLLLANRTTTSWTREYISQTGQKAWLLWRNVPIFDQAGEIVEVQSVGHDLTEQRIAQEALKTSETRYRTMIEMQRDLICRWTPDFVITYANEAYAEHHERLPDAIIGRNVFDLISHPEERALVRAHIEANMPIRQVTEHAELFHSPSGRQRWIRWVDIPIVDDRGNIVEYHTVGHDLSDIKQAQDAEQIASARYQSLVNSVEAIVWEIHPITFVNTFMSPQAERILGISVAAFMADADLWQGRIHPDDRALATHYSRAQIALGQDFELEYRFITQSGKVIWLHDTVTIVFDDDGQPLRVRGISIDVSARKQVEEVEAEQRRFAEALRETSAFISGTLDLEEVLDRILTVMPRVLPGGVTDIMMVQGAEGVIVRSRGYAERGLASAVNELRVSIHHDARLRYMMGTGEALLINDVQREPGWQQGGMFGWVRAQMAAPVRLDGETIGFLTMSDEQPDAYTYKHLAQLQAFADQVSIAIRNAHLYRAVQRYADHLETLVGERTAELQLERQRLQIILDSTGDSIFYTEGDQIRFANVALGGLTGYSAAELDGMRLEQLEASTDGETQFSDVGFASLRSVLRALPEVGIWRGEVRLRRHDGSTFDAGVTMSAMRNAQSSSQLPGVAGGDAPPLQSVRAVTTVRDISREKALALQKSLFVAHASHELRTPLTNFKTRLYLLRRSPQRLEEHLDILDNVAERMRRLVEDLLDISRFERGIIPLEHRALDVVALTRRVVHMQLPEAEARQQQLACIAPDQPMWVVGDADRLTQVITNLVTNALNYTPAGGQVHVTVTAAPARQPDDPATSSDDVRICVEDTGIGITEDDLAHIFQPFFRVVSTVEGTGLGLSISKAIAEQHGGTIEATSQPGVGSTFTLCLPLSHTAAAADQQQHHAEETHLALSVLQFGR